MMKKDKSLNDEQNLAVYSRGSSILVSAPAGSGKTKILVNRIMSLIEDDHINVNELLVLTFTKAAAIEMKQRLVEALDQRIQNSQDQLKEHLIKQKLLLNDAYITNFHSFCSDLLSQYGYLIQIDANFQILENPAVIKAHIFDQCLDQWVQQSEFKDFYQSHYVGYQFDQLKDIIFQLDNLSHTIYHFDDYIKDVKMNLYDQIIQNHSYHNTPFESYLKNILIEAYQEGYNSYLRLCDFCQQFGLSFFFEKTAKFPSPQETLEKYYLSIETMIKQDTLLTNKKPVLEKSRNASFKNVDESIKKQYTELFVQAKKTFSDIYDKCVPSSIDELSQILKVSFESLKQYLYYLKQFQNKYQQYKHDYQYLDFNDLEQYTLQLLDKQYGVSEILYHQLHEIMIDEYQDTNEIQENLILKIACFHNPEINRFMVGDMKQSIYRFRKADLDIFNQKYLTYGKGNHNQRIDLKFNYRSHKIVLDSINYIFNAIMDSRYGGLEYDRDPHAKLNYDFLRKDKCESLEAKQQKIELLNQEHRFDTEIMLVLKPEERSVDMVEYEALMMGKKIIEMIGQLDLDFPQGSRKARLKDIVVLSRNVGNFMTYKKVFDRIHIPNLIVLTKGFFESPEIIDCFSFLKAISNCLDDISMISILKGNYQWSHFDESWIYLHKLENMSMYASLCQSQDKEAIEFLDYYHEMVNYSHTHTVYELLEKFLQDSQYDTFVCSLYNGQQRYENIQLFLEMLKEDQDLSLHQIVTKIDQTIKENIDYKPATLCQDGDAVVFMTIHQSKGLEFPIVFVNQLNHQFNFADSKAPLIQDKKLGMILNAYVKTDLDDYQDVVIEYQNPLRGIFSYLLDNETINEEMRILYVALTRASQKLILTGGLKSIDMIDKWQKQIIDYALDGHEHLLPATIRKSNNMLNWIMLSIIRHPDFTKQCADLSLFDAKISNRYDLSFVKENAAKIRIYEETEFSENTMHAKFKTHIIDCETIDEYIYPKIVHTQNYETIYQNNSQFHYQYDNELDKTIAVTSLISDGDRYYPDLRFDEDTSNIQSTSRGTIIHSLLEKLPLVKNMNLTEELQHIIEQEHYDEDIQKLIFNYQNHIQDFLDSDVYQLMLNSPYCYKEKEFSFVSDTKQIIHGIFDVVCIQDYQITIIDYKTDRVSKNTAVSILEELHQQQMDYYKKIMKMVFPDYHIQAIVYYLHINQYVII